VKDCQESGLALSILPYTLQPPNNNNNYKLSGKFKVSYENETCVDSLIQKYLHT
jgi:hypothetical protein